MKIAKEAIIALSVVVLATASITGLYFYKLGFQIIPSAGPIDCGTEDILHESNSEIRTCILNALKTCTPAYARAYSNSPKADGLHSDHTVTVQKNPAGQCGVQFVGTGKFSSGDPYSYNTFCSSVTMSGPAFGGGFLLLKDCEENLHGLSL